MALASLAIASLAFAAPAHADDDTAYLSALHKRGISMSDGDAGLIKYGHMVCGLLSDGYSMDALEAMADLHERNGISDDDVKFMIKAAAASYCPDYIR
jgi:hypothetical protein